MQKEIIFLTEKESRKAACGKKADSTTEKAKSAAVPCTRRALALAYFPDATPDCAVRRLHCWIKRCKPLYDLLTAGDAAFDRRKIITVREAMLIMEYLGEPGEEP